MLEPRFRSIAKSLMVCASLATASAATSGCHAPVRVEHVEPARVEEKRKSVGEDAETSEPTSEEGDDEEELKSLLSSDAELTAWMNDATRRRLQILVSIPDEDGTVRRRRLSFRADKEYFYPASAIKTCIALGAVDKLDELDNEANPNTKAKLYPPLSLDTPMAFHVDASAGKKRPARGMRTTVALKTTLRRDLEKALVTSDNDAANRLFDFVGREELAERLHRLGIRDAHIVQHLGVPEEPSSIPAIELLPPKKKPIVVAQRLGFQIPPHPWKEPLLLGEGYIDAASGRLVRSPMDFSPKNSISLRALQDALIAIVASSNNANNNKNGNMRALFQTMGLLPSDLPLLKKARVSRDQLKLTDTLFKPLHLAMVKALPQDKVSVYSKGGRAYGFSVENAYAINETTDRAMYVTLTVYSNSNDVFNDDRYEYVSIANPLVERLGAVLAQKYLR